MTVVQTAPTTAAAAGAAADSFETTATQSDWRDRYPAWAVEVDWPATRGDRAEVDQLVASATVVLPSERVRESRRWGLPLLLDWLADQPGSTEIWREEWECAAEHEPDGSSQSHCTRR